MSAARRLRVVVLLHEDLIPPETDEDMSDADRAKAQFWAEYDVVHALRALGHEVRVLGVADDLVPLRELAQSWRPQVVFNLLNELKDVGAFEVHVASYLELLGLPYTGCNPRGLLLARDKPLSKKIFRHHRIDTPAFAVLRRGRRVAKPRGLEFPLIVKSSEEDASLGVSQASVVWSEEELVQRVDFVHRTVGTSALAEEYIEGRELTIGILGNERLTTFPIWEMIFENLPSGSEPIATAHAKWNWAYQEKVGLSTKPAVLEASLAQRIAHDAKRAYRCLALSGFARLDIRLREDGRFFFIEANPNPDISEDEDFALAALEAGIEYDALIQRIVNLALRYRPPWKID
jgi:D-alanine-D-alanine ligase